MRTSAGVVILVVFAGLFSPSAQSQTPNETHSLDARGRPLGDSRYDEIRSLEAQEERGISLYRSEKYQEAYAQLATPASRGLKASQHAIALMHLNGQSVPANVLVGTALFGLAAESGDKQLQKEYKKLLDRVQEKYRSLVSEQTVYYIQRYGMSAQGVTCDKVKRPSSNLSTMICLKQPGIYQEYAWAP